MTYKRSKSRGGTSTFPAGSIERAAWIAGIMVLIFLAVKMPCIAICIGIAILLSMGAAKATSTAFGSAKWAEQNELQKSGLLGNRGLILGRSLGNRAGFFRGLARLFTSPLAESQKACRYFRRALGGGRELETPLIRLRRGIHGLICAPSGAGKGVSIVIPNLLTYVGSCITIDPKGENYQMTAKVRRRHLKNRVIRLDPLGECGPGGQHFNPLAHLDPTSPLLGEKAASLADSLVVQTGTEMDPHWNQMAILGIKSTIVYVSVYGAPADRTLNAVADIITNVDSWSGMVAMMQDKNGDMAKTHGHLPAYRLMQRLGNAMASWQDRELASILSSIGRHVSWLNNSLIEEHLSFSDFDPRDLVRENMTIYLVLPPSSLITLGRLLRLWITSFFDSITELGPQEDREVLWLLDESGNIGPLPALLTALTIGRGYGLRLWLILQSLAQLKTLFPKDGDHQTAEASIDNRVLFGIRDYESAEATSKYLGTATVAVTSETTSRGSTQTGNVFSEKHYSRSTNEGTSETRSETGRRLLMPDEILQLPSDSAIILTKGSRPILAKLAKFYQTPELAHLMPYVGSVK